jgi:hypothetical protein
MDGDRMQPVGDGLDFLVVHEIDSRFDSET